LSINLASVVMTRIESIVVVDDAVAFVTVAVAAVVDAAAASST